MTTQTQVVWLSCRHHRYDEDWIPVTLLTDFCHLQYPAGSLMPPCLSLSPPNTSQYLDPKLQTPANALIYIQIS